MLVSSTLPSDLFITDIFKGLYRNDTFLFDFKCTWQHDDKYQCRILYASSRSLHCGVPAWIGGAWVGSSAADGKGLQLNMVRWKNLNRGGGIAQWLERRTRDWKVAGSNPCWNGGRIFFSRVDFLCWLLFRYPFHPRVTTVARKKSRSFCQKCRWQVTAKHAYTLRASALVTTCP